MMNSSQRSQNSLLLSSINRLNINQNNVGNQRARFTGVSLDSNTIDTLGQKKGEIQCGLKQIPILSQAENANTISKREKDEILSETVTREENLDTLVITKSLISLYSWEETKAIAPIRIINTNLVGNGSVNDPRMGVVSLNVSCQYCSQIDCPGHYGLIEFPSGRPIYNPSFIRNIVSVLTCVCNDCGGLLITEDVIIQQGFSRLNHAKRLSALEKYCEKELVCLRQKPQLEGGVLVPCAKNPIFITTDIRDKGKITYKLPAAEQGGRKSKGRGKTEEIHIMSIETVINILNRISDEDAQLLGFPRGSHPRNTIMRGILVPPVIARPPVFDGGNIHHDQLTHMFITIMRKVQDLEKAKTTSTIDLYDAVKQLVYKSDNKKMGMKEISTIIDRIQGKTAILRGLLMGKRVNYCGRTVAGPDPSLTFGQIRIPEIWAQVLTKKITVTNFNIQYLTNLLRDGKITHITPKKIGLRKFYYPNQRYNLKIGDKVDRWLENGDRIVNNRQPTLHKQSMMAYTVVLGQQLTIGLHLSYTTPMNCDFDGDENNVWNPQDFEVEAEAELLLNVKKNIMSAEQNRPIMGLVMNSITGAFLLTRTTTRVDDDLFNELINIVTNKSDIQSLYQRLTKYGVHPRSGQAVFSSMLPSDFYYNHKNILIMEGILIKGQLTKSHVGPSHRSIIQELWKNYGSQRTSDFFTDAPIIINKWLIETGFTVGLLDCVSLAIDPETGDEYDKNKRILEQELAKIYVRLEALGGTLSDSFEESYRQRQINDLVNVANGIGLRLAKEALSGDNAIGVMTDQGAGTKGGIANIGQMFGCVGQQFYHGERLKTTITNGTRLLPVFDSNDNNPRSHGFISNSFFTGINAADLFALQAGGREGLLDTSLKTAETGAMQHRMIKAFENIKIADDGSIRNTSGTIFTPMYNSGYNPAEMLTIKYQEKSSFTCFVDIHNLAHSLNIQRSWIPKETHDLINGNRAKLSTENFVENILPLVSIDYSTKKPKSIPYNINNPVSLSPLSVTQTKLNKFEKSRIIGTRATQLSNNAPPLIAIGDEIDPVKIALMEYDQGVIPLYIVRNFSDGSYKTVPATLDNI